MKVLTVKEAVERLNSGDTLEDVFFDESRIKQGTMRTLSCRLSGGSSSTPTFYLIKTKNMHLKHLAICTLVLLFGTRVDAQCTSPASASGGALPLMFSQYNS